MDLKLCMFVFHSLPTVLTVSLLVSVSLQGGLVEIEAVAVVGPLSDS